MKPATLIGGRQGVAVDASLFVRLSCLFNDVVIKRKREATLIVSSEFHRISRDV